jgi:mannose-6-phosphate isomerase-like protein (cupin superfamily)
MRKLTADVAPDSIGHVTLVEAQALLPTPDGKRSAAVFEHGTLQVKLYAPRGGDAQTPHTRDEIYVVARGSGWFVNGERRHRFAPDDVIFAKAGDAHRFEEFSDDFSVWVFFYGPEGGEFDAATAPRGG